MNPKLIITAIIGVVIVSTILIPVVKDSTEGPAENDNLNVYVLAGQSNSAYYNADVTVANENPAIKNDFAFYYGTSESPIECGTIVDMDYDTTFESYGIYSMTDSDGNFRIGNIEAPFASTFVNETNQKCLIINTGIGGVSIDSYVPGSVGFTYATDVIEDALSKIPDTYNVIKRGVLWVQGESNNAMQITRYIGQFESMFNGFKDLGFDSVFISQTRAINGGNATVAQGIISETVNGAYLACDAASSFSISAGTIASDNLHYTQKGDNIIGKDLAEYVIVKTGFPTKMDTQHSDLIMIVPLLVVVGLIMMIVAVIVSRRE